MAGVPFLPTDTLLPSSSSVVLFVGRLNIGIDQTKAHSFIFLALSSVESLIS